MPSADRPRCDMQDRLGQSDSMTGDSDGDSDMSRTEIRIRIEEEDSDGAPRAGTSRWPPPEMAPTRV